METLFVTRNTRLRQRENTIHLYAEGQHKPLPIEHIAHLVLLGENELNSRFLSLCGKHAVRISIFDYYGYYKGTFEPIERNPAGRVKLLQAELLLDKPRCMLVARELVRAAAHNMRANLQYYLYRGNTALTKSIYEINAICDRLHKAEDNPTLMGMEGNIHQWYYDAWPIIDEKLRFSPRVRRPPNNPINCLLSFLNQLTYTVVRHELFKTHLEETFSILHSPLTQGRSSLSLDISEPFKPILSDMLIFRMINKNMFNSNWFDQQEGVCLLTETGRRHVTEQFANRLEEQYQGRSFREWIYQEALAIERHILGVAEYSAFRRKV